jgi:hypothetical protein
VGGTEIVGGVVAVVEDVAAVVDVVVGVGTLVDGGARTDAAGDVVGRVLGGAVDGGDVLVVFGGAA